MTMFICLALTAAIMVIGYILVMVGKAYHQAAADAVMYKNGYDTVHKAFENLKKRLSDEKVVQIPSDRYYTFACFTREEHDVIGTALMRYIKTAGFNSVNDYDAVSKLIRKNSKVFANIQKSMPLVSSDIGYLMEKSMVIPYLFVKDHDKGQDKDFIPSI